MSGRLKACARRVDITSSSASAKRPRDVSCLSVVSFNSTKRRVQSFIISYVGYRFVTACSPTTDDRSFELLWVRVDQTFIGSLYHPPRASYTTDDLINYIDVCITELTALYPGVVTILAGDFNQLSDCDLVQRTGLTPIVTQPTRAASFLDRIYVSRPAYNTVRVIKSLVRSDHSAVVARA